MAGTAGRAGLRRAARPAERQNEPAASATADSRNRAAAVPEKYFDLNVRHFHEKLKEVEGIELSYTWVEQALQGAGFVARKRRRSPHRRRRPRREIPGMMLHIDGSKHRWFQDDRYYDLIVVMDDATSEIYYAQLVSEESTRTVMTCVRG